MLKVMLKKGFTIALLLLGLVSCKKENIDTQTITAEGAKFEMKLIKGATFTMGSPSDEVDRYEDELQHEVVLTDYYIGVYEVTQKQFSSIMGYNPTEEGITKEIGDNYPVSTLSWEEAVLFTEKLSQKTGRKFRLPTEAEWEYACRAGSTTPFNTGENLTTDQANYDGDQPYNGNEKGQSVGNMTAVGFYAPNAFGLYDMHGNVSEFVSDFYSKEYYSSSPKTNPTGPAEGSTRVVRGGYWFGSAAECRSAYREAFKPDITSHLIGFRLVMEL